jgi:hypothetical protein
MSTRVLDLRAGAVAPAGLGGAVRRAFGLWSPPPVGPASDVVRLGPTGDPGLAARAFVDREGTLSPGRLDLVVARVHVGGAAVPTPAALSALAEEVRSLRTDGTLGLVCLTPVRTGAAVADLAGGAYDFVVRVGPDDDAVPRLVGALDTARESLHDLRGAYDAGVARVRPDASDDAFDVAADLRGRTLDPLFGEESGDPPDHCVVATPERFVPGVRDGIDPASLLGWAPTREEVRVVGFHAVG